MFFKSNHLHFQLLLPQPKVSALILHGYLPAQHMVQVKRLDLQTLAFHLDLQPNKRPSKCDYWNKRHLQNDINNSELDKKE